MNRTVVVDSDWHFDSLCGSHLQSQCELYHVSWWYYTLVVDLIGWLFNTGLTNDRVIQENEGSERANYLSHNKLTPTCFYLFLGEKKNVKDHFMPYAVWPVALAWYVFSKWLFNRDEDNKK